MEKYRHKRAFTTGEVSPLVTARTDVKRYNNALYTCLNAYPLVQGPATKRTGLLFVHDMTDHVSDLGTISGIKLIPFVFDKDTSYCLVFFTGATGSRVFFAQYDETVVDVNLRYGLIEDPLVAGTPYSLDIATPFDIDKIDYAQAGDILTMVQHETRPKELRRLAVTGDDWEITEPTFTDQPDDWGDPPTSSWPATFTYYEQRAMYGGTIGRPQTVWGSKSGDFYDFGTSAELVESDAITYTIASGDQNKILWMNSARQLLIGTLGDEWTMSGAGAPLSFRSVQANRQTNRGSERLKPIMIGSATLFLQRHARDVNEFIYDWANDSYEILDLTILAPHLTEHYGISDWGYQQTPNSIVWAVRDDGTLLGLTYQRRNKVVGWHRHTTDGSFKSVCSTPNGYNREDDLWCLVEREIGGSTKWYLEAMQPEFKSDTAYDAFFLDSALVYDYPEAPTTTITGLDHLEGETVSVLAEGTVLPPKTVVGGEISLDPLGGIQGRGYVRVVVGLPYTTIIQPVMGEVALRDGTSQGRTQRITAVALQFYRTLGAWIGRDLDNLEVLPFRVPADNMGEAVPLFNGVYQKAFPEGYDDESTIYIVSDQPLPLTLLGIVDDVEIFD